MTDLTDLTEGKTIPYDFMKYHGNHERATGNQFLVDLT